MAPRRFAVLVLVMFVLAVIATGPHRTRGQTPDIQEQIQELLDALRDGMNARRTPPSPPQALPEPDGKLVEATRKTSGLLDEFRIDCKPFQKEMSLAKLLVALEQQIPKGTVKLRIDSDAFDDKKPPGRTTRKEIEATVVRLPGAGTISLRTALRLAIQQMKGKADYRIDPGQVTITAPERTLSVRAYDIADLVEKPAAVRHLSGFAAPPTQKAPGDIEQRAEELVQTLVSAVSDYRSNTAIADRETIQVLNGRRLLIQTTRDKHAQIEELLDALRRLGDLTVFVSAQLYEVDDGTYKKIENARRSSPREQEEKAAAEKGAAEKPLVKKENLVLANNVELDVSIPAALLSRHQVVDLLPSLEQAIRGETGRQAIFEGISFLGQVAVSADRRSVRLRLTEKAGEIQEICGGKLTKPVRNVEGAESALVKETSQSQVLEIADGGSMLVAVQHRPRALRAKDRWWVLVLTPRIHIPAEEQMIRLTTLEELLPAVVADILKNPRLKSTRDFYGTAADKRFALINSGVFAWPAELPVNLADYKRCQPDRQGKRLLAIRVDRYQEPTKENDRHVLTVTLRNEGGNENGAVVGSGTIHYTARQVDGAWKVELSEATEP